MGRVFSVLQWWWIFGLDLFGRASSLCSSIHVCFDLSRLFILLELGSLFLSLIFAKISLFPWCILIWVFCCCLCSSFGVSCWTLSCFLFSELNFLLPDWFLPRAFTSSHLLMNLDLGLWGFPQKNFSWEVCQWNLIWVLCYDSCFLCWLSIWLLSLDISVVFVNLGLKGVVIGDVWLRGHELDYYYYWVWDECHFHCVCLHQIDLWETQRSWIQANVWDRLGDWSRTGRYWSILCLFLHVDITHFSLLILVCYCLSSRLLVPLEI